MSSPTSTGTDSALTTGAISTLSSDQSIAEGTISSSPWTATGTTSASGSASGTSAPTPTSTETGAAVGLVVPASGSVGVLLMGLFALGLQVCLLG